MCGNCHCILDENNGGDVGDEATICPPLPSLYTSSDYDEEVAAKSTSSSLSLTKRYPKLITWLKTQKPMNPYTLGNCNPYTEDNCETQPAQNRELLELQDTAVCAIHYNHYKNTDGDTGYDSGDEIEKDVELDSGSQNTTVVIGSSNGTTTPTNNNSATISFASSTSPNEDEDCGSYQQKYNMYTLHTYASYEDAIFNGGFVTHVGACGVCSTLQDLAVYLSNPDLTSKGEFCAKQGLISFETSTQCYVDLGLSESCAYIWATNSANTATQCFTECATSDIIDDISSTSDSIKSIIHDSEEDTDRSNNGGNSNNNGNNGPPPTCQLNDCLQCDEDKSGKIFQQYGGRTRRRSGLLSAIVRPCNSLIAATDRVYDLKKLINGVVNATSIAAEAEAAASDGGTGGACT